LFADPDSLIVSLPLLALSVPALLIALLLMFSSAQFRTGFLVFGGLLALGGKDIDATKIVYLGGAMVAFIIAITRARHLDSWDRRLLRVALALGAMTFVSLGVALAMGTSLGSWARESIAVCLLAAMPVFVIDLRGDESNQLLVPMFVAGGTLAAVSWSVSWLGRRSLSGFDTDTFLMPSIMFPAALFAYAVAGAQAVRRSRVLWAALAIFVLTCMLITGTRSSWVFLLMPIFVSFALSGNIFRALVRLAIFSAFMVLLALALMRYIGSATKADVSKIEDRLASTVTLVENPSSDESFLQRAAETLTLWKAFASSPIVGVGPGYGFTYVIEGSKLANRTKEDTGLVDSPLTLPAKYGLIGLLLTGIAGFAIASLVRSPGFNLRQEQARIAAFSYALFSVLAMLIGAVFQDKGMAFGFLFLLALSVPPREYQEAQLSPELSDVRA
jgi:hypothetical protein